MLKRTSLYESHQKCGARLVEFGGWEMPVQYSSIIDEHHAVRRASGLFDISHMGEIFVTGREALAFVNHVLTNDARELELGQGQYTLLCNEEGGVVDDLYLFHIAESEYLLVVNASRIDAVDDWLAEIRSSGTWENLRVENRSDQLSAVAVQGPRVSDFIGDCVPGTSAGGRSGRKVTELLKNEIADFEHEGESLLVSRTGYTGEDGFEFVGTHSAIVSLWDRLLAEGHRGCLQPCGLGARDTLRTEMGYPLYGHELSETISPLEAGLGFFVKLGKGPFMGSEALQIQKTEGVARRSVAFKMVGKTPPPRPEYNVKAGGTPIGLTTSGSVSPSLKTGIGMALVEIDYAKSGTDLTIEIRGREFPALAVKKPIYSKS